MTKALISLECLRPSDWDLIPKENSKLIEFLATAGWELENIDTESVRAFPEAGSAQGVAFQTNEMPVISFSRIAAVSAEYPGIISATINFTEPAVIHGREKRELQPELKTGAARVRLSIPRLLSEQELGLGADNQG